MRKLVVIEYVSLDGVVQAPGHAGEDRAGGFAHGGWTGPQLADHRRHNSDSFQTAGAFLLGRLTYEIWAGYWPTVTDETDEIARALNTLPKYVASRTLENPGWAGTIVIRDVPREVAELKEKPGKPILVMGSAQLAQTLIEQDLVDEYQLWLHPIVLGSGKRLFRDGAPKTELQLVDSRTSRAGLAILTYERSNVSTA
jgi:dihydrofolate reductase